MRCGGYVVWSKIKEAVIRVHVHSLQLLPPRTGARVCSPRDVKFGWVRTAGSSRLYRVIVTVVVSVSRCLQLWSEWISNCKGLLRKSNTNMNSAVDS